MIEFNPPTIMFYTSKVKKMYSFLSNPKHRKYNEEFQRRWLNRIFNVHGETKDNRIIQLFYEILNTRSQSKMDTTAKFFMDLLSDKENYSSFSGFVNFLKVNNRKGISTEHQYKWLHSALDKAPGWGPKTSALLIKIIYETHYGRFQEFAFWDDVPEISEGDCLYVPVDRVIENAFMKLLRNNESKATFNNINRFLANHYKSPDEIIVWDDLWFWGFFSKDILKSDKPPFFNEGKYWANDLSGKEKKVTDELAKLCDDFGHLMFSKNI